jgi:spermidine synthase
MALWFTENQSDNVRFSFKVKEQLFHGKSNYQTLDYYDSYEFGRVMVLDNIIMLTEKDEFIYHEMIVHPAFMVNPDIKKVLIIGGGDGGTLREVLKHDVTTAELVDIDDLVLKTAPEFIPFTGKALKDSRATVMAADGIEYMKTKSNEYDLIIIDSTDPISVGEGLFTKEFYKNCFKALKENGILINQAESPFYYEKQFLNIYEKLNSIFPVFSFYSAPVPTYGSGYWMFGFASKKYHPLNNFKPNSFDLSTMKYYNLDIHKAAFIMPNFVKKLLG